MPALALSRVPEAVVSDYAKVARPILIDLFGVKSCVESTRVTVACLQRFRVQAEAMPASLRVKSTASGWACGLTEEEIKALADGLVNAVRPAKRGEGTTSRSQRD